MEQNKPQPTVWVGCAVEEAEGPTSTLERGESAVYTFGLSLLGAIRTLLMRRGDLRITVSVLDIEIPATDQEMSAARLIGTCQGLIECFQAGDPWTLEARTNAAAELRAGIAALTGEAV